MGGGAVRSRLICPAAGHSGDEGSESGKGRGRLSSKGMKTTSTWSPSSSGGVLLWFRRLSLSSLSRRCISLWVNNVKKKQRLIYSFNDDGSALFPFFNDNREVRFDGSLENDGVRGWRARETR